MSEGKQRYRDVSPVTLQVAGGVVTSSLYCGEVEGLGAGLVEAFMVELYRCKLCHFTCGLKASISSHLLNRHRPPSLTFLGGSSGGGGAEDREEVGLRRGGASPYQFDLHGESKQSDEDEDFLLYNMLDSMSPPTCDISSEVAHTCEVSTLFEEESSVDLSIPPPATQEEMAQSAHLMTLGLCRISATKPPRASSQLPQPPAPPSPKPEPDAPARTPPPSRRCPLCPATLPSRRLQDVHVRSHGAAGGFSCVCCNWTTDSWEELEPHWRSCRRRGEELEPHWRSCRRRGEELEPHWRSCRRRGEELEPHWRSGRRREEHKQQKKKTTSRPFRCPLCVRRFRNAASRNAHQLTHSDGWRSRLIGREGKEAEPADRLQAVSPQKKKKSKTNEEEEKPEGEATFCCSLCLRKFSSKLTLRRHLGTHGADKPFSCDTCSYRGRLKASLLQHLRTHTGEKPFRCSLCSYASIDRSSLLRHSRTHSKEKPYGCDQCEYRSIQKKSLDLHARRHHTGEAFPCQQCEYSSPDRQLLLKHVRRHHSCDLTGHRTL